MSRLDTCFAELALRGEKALVTFITAGDPDLATTERLVPIIEKAGADILELGMPFSDPMADGPAIQLSSERALESGTTLKKIMASVSVIRRTVTIPIVLMGYLNPIHAYGFEKFANDAVKAGVDAVLIVDMPPEESSSFLQYAKNAGLQTIFLLTPTSDEPRMRQVAELGSGFVYYVTVTGVTGVRQEVSSGLADELANIKKHISSPIVAGFGISTKEQGAEVAQYADGVVVGSAIVKLFQNYRGERLETELANFIKELKTALPKTQQS